MKKAGLLMTLALVISTTAMSQQGSLGEEYWVVETHTHDTIFSVVRFFDGNDNLLHEVRIENVAIDIQQKKHRKRLDQLLANYQLRKANSVKKIKPRTSV